MNNPVYGMSRFNGDRSEDLLRLLQETESRYQALESNLSDPYVAYDLHGKVLRLNAYFEEAFGWTSDELLGRKVPYVPDDQQDESMKSIKAALDGNPSPLRAQRLTKDGRRVNVLITRARFVDVAGAPTGHIAVCRRIPQGHETASSSSEQGSEPEGKLNCIDCNLQKFFELSNPHGSVVKDAVGLLIELVQTHKMELRERVKQSLRTSVLPLVGYLKASDLSPSQKNLVDTLDFALAHMCSRFGSGFPRQERPLSPRETQICGLIVSGQDSRTIARTLGLTYQTVILHRKNIRKKLGLDKNKQNLESYIREKLTPDVYSNLPARVSPLTSL